eukprot:6182368-Pleurochrysis_carterae.AAC.1
MAAKESKVDQLEVRVGHFASRDGRPDRRGASACLSALPVVGAGAIPVYPVYCRSEQHSATALAMTSCTLQNLLPFSKRLGLRREPTAAEGVSRRSRGGCACALVRRSPRGALRVSAQRESMHAVIPAVHALVERAQRVRSFSAQDGDKNELVTLDFFVVSAHAHVHTHAHACTGAHRHREARAHARRLERPGARVHAHTDLHSRVRAATRARMRWALKLALVRSETMGLPASAQMH